jgi:hypothetical protein
MGTIGGCVGVLDRGMIQKGMLVNKKMLHEPLPR